MKKKILSLFLSTAENIATGEEKCISLGATERFVYSEGKKTDTIDSIVLTAISESLGEIQFSFSPRTGLVEKLNRAVSFGSTFSISEIGNVTDVKISVFNGALIIKYLTEVR